jgi:hypothetical protein
LLEGKAMSRCLFLFGVAVLLIVINSAMVVNGLSVNVPSEVIHGNNITVKIQSDKANYDHIWVVLPTGLKTYVERVITDDNGSASVNFSTNDLYGGGVFHIYVRDTNGTYSCQSELECVIKCYDIPPTNSFAEYFKADDDILWVGEVRVIDPDFNFSYVTNSTGCVKLMNVPTEVRTTRGDPVTITLQINRTDKDTIMKTYVNVTFIGRGVIVTPNDYDNFKVVFDDHGYANIVIEPYYNTSTNRFESQAGVDDVAIFPGMYQVKVELYYNGSKVQEAGIKLIVDYVSLDIDCPLEVNKGEDLNVEIDTNHKAGYSHIYVVLDTPNPIVRRLTTDYSGRCTAIIRKRFYFS